MVLAARRGDRKAQAATLKKFERAACAVTMKFRGGAFDAEDLHQEALLAVLDAIREYDPDRGPMLHAVHWAARTRMGVLTKQARGVKKLVLDEAALAGYEQVPDESVPQPLEVCIRAQLSGVVRTRLQPVLERLSAKERQVFDERIVAGRKLSAIAAERGVSKQCVSVMEIRVRGKIRSALDDVLG